MFKNYPKKEVSRTQLLRSNKNCISCKITLFKVFFKILTGVINYETKTQERGCMHAEF